MKTSIRHCPHCTQLIHFRASQPVQCCWNCGQMCDLSRVLSAHEIVFRGIFRALDHALPDPQRLKGAAKVALVGAIVPTAAMLFVCNGFNVRIVYDFAAPFFQF